MEENYIVLYADEFPSSTWRQYCEAMGISSSTTEAKVVYTRVDVLDYEGNEDEDYEEEDEYEY